jgi:hypothetical protein
MHYVENTRGGLHVERKRLVAAQNGAPGWTAGSWLLSLRVLDILSKEMLAASDRNVAELDRIKYTTDDEISHAVDVAAVQMKSELREAVARLRVAKDVDARELNEKFAADGSAFTFRYAGMEEYHGGLEGMLGNPDPRVAEAVAWEHTQSPDSAKLFPCWWIGETTPQVEYAYVANQAAKQEETKNGTREKGRDAWTLGRFIAENKALVDVSAGGTATVNGLQEVEVVVLRLYTGPMYVWYNNLLRFLSAEYDAKMTPFADYKREGGAIPFKTTLHVLNSAIIKLSRTQPAERVYRGTKGGVLPEEFWRANDHNVRGGIELAFMSTTTDRAIAMDYAKSDDKPSILFEMQMGMIDRGAPLQWCSQFPAEAEILFAPLTGLEVVGAPKVEQSVIVVELRLSCNLHDLTIEQILAKMQKTHLDLVDIVRIDITLLGFPRAACYALDEHEKTHTKRQAKWFNSTANYMEATKMALQCKLAACEHVVLQCNYEAIANEGAITKEHVRLGPMEAEALRILLDPTDAMALQYGILSIIKNGVLDR